MLPFLNLSIDALARTIDAALIVGEEIDATKKRKVDGTLAATRLGSTATERWCNERFRQTMLLVREFRMEWPNKTLLTSDDVESIRWLVDCALYTATRAGHVGDIYDMNPTVWAIWLVQNQHALKAGGWKAESVAAQQRLSFENLYLWLREQHARGENKNLYDPTTNKLLKRYKLPFKQMTVPPAHNNMFKYVKGARRLSDWIFDCQNTVGESDRPVGAMGLARGIIVQQPPELVPPPPQSARREARRQAAWERVTKRARSRRRPMRTAQEDSEDAEQTRDIVAAVLAESDRAQGGSSTEPEDELERALEEAMQDTQSDDELERELEEALREGEHGGPSAEAETPQSRDEPQQPRGVALDELRDLLMRD